MNNKSNFDFIGEITLSLVGYVNKSEKNANQDSRTACFYARYALEQAIKWLYKHDKSLSYPYNDNLMALIHEPSFKQNLSPHPALFPKLLNIVKLGNRAVHDSRPIATQESTFIVKELWHFFVWLYKTYTPPEKQVAIPPFDESLLKQHAPADQQKTKEELQALQDKFERQEKAAQEAEENNMLLAQELHRVREELARVKAENEKRPDTHDYNEDETRDFYIDLLLREAGWDPQAKNTFEFPVKGMPNKAGDGYCDYALWGDNGLPLAVVEAKRTRVSPEKGRKQASLYADCLEKMYNQRPIIFYTNGYEHFIWDDSFYPPRAVQGFYNKEELQTLINRREDRSSFKTARINKDIVNRYYQHEAIKAVCSHLEDRERKSLIVMATGAGKTRTTIALVDVLMRHNWVKRVLFLADRIALVEQAHGAFKHHLSSATVVDLTKEKEDQKSRIMFSTYPTMMGLINETNGKQKRFGSGYFDLIILDEAHRSVYKKYGAIFDYFDSLLVGLTATPREDADRDTYNLFELQKGVPTYYYELDQAITDNYLVPPRKYGISLQLPSRGLKYSQLAQDEKEHYEECFYDEETDSVPEQVDGEAFNRWLFNENTVDIVLKTLMEHGVKVEGGDKLGKTIIFARSHKHAEFIFERFNKHYPAHAGKFAAVIDNYINYVGAIRRDFSKKDALPQIAISVDMLDTGVDIPEVVNLVFFKPVFSKVKFHQMIGRGTRLCPDLFGPGQDKQGFLIFDFCGNFEYFESNPEGSENSAGESLSTKLFKRRFEIADLLNAKEFGDDTYRSLRNDLLDRLNTEVNSMNTDNFIVRPKRKTVEKFQNRDAWNTLSPVDKQDVVRDLAELPTEMPSEEENAKRFDLLMFNIQLAILTKDYNFDRYIQAVKKLMQGLELKSAIPMVKNEMELIEALQSDEYWQNITVPMVDSARKRLRELIQYIDRKGREIVYSNFEDGIAEFTVDENPISISLDLPEYKAKVTAYIKQQQNDLVINKLKNNMAITKKELEHLEELLFKNGEFEDRKKFEKAFGHQEHLGLFIRKMVGLDRNAAKNAFTDFIQSRKLNPSQIRFVDLIINYLTQNGVMDIGALYEAPFTDLHELGVEAVFPDVHGDSLIEIIRGIEKNAQAA
jgi:type I restriction enzyme R subunit